MNAGETSWLALDDVTLCYGTRCVLRSLSVALTDRHPSLALVGPSGSGKSTILGLLAGHLHPAAGRIALCGAEVEGPSPTQPLVFQDHALFPWKSVLGNVTFGLKCAGLGRAEREAKARALLKELGLAGTEALWPHQLSGGMRQRVGLARALVLQPRCLLLDEPFSAVDETARWALQRLLLGTRSNVPQPHWVIATHDPGEAVRLGASLLVLRPGVPSVLLDNPGWPHSAKDTLELAMLPMAAATLRALRATLNSEAGFKES